MNTSLSSSPSSSQSHAASIHLAVRRSVRHIRPRNADQLHAFVRTVLGFRIPRRPMIVGHDAPFDYVTHAFFETCKPRDAVVWANRGGGKTQIGAIVTLLDMLFKPGIQVRILGGSFEQSSKMYRYLKQMLEHEAFCDLIAGNLTGRYVELINGSRVEVLSQSERAVRGQRVHKLRCDEVELFDPDVWDAAQLITRSGQCGDVFVHGAIETLSTMHKPYGLMQKIVADATRSSASSSSLTARRVFRWSVLDTLSRCEPQRACASCALWPECQGRAKAPTTRGFFRIDDALQHKSRVSVQVWAAEMLCEKPDRSDSVYPEFDPQVHVVADDVADAADSQTQRLVIGGMDFGFRAPTVLLWAHVDGEGVVTIVDELIERERNVEEIITLAEQRSRLAGRGKPAWIGADPAGHQRNDQTGISTITLWRRAGWQVRTRQSRIEHGIEAVCRRLRTADGSVRLRICQRCEQLICALTMYRYPAQVGEGSGRTTARCLLPLKDGHDHAADALRYMIVNLDRDGASLKVRGY